MKPINFLLAAEMLDDRKETYSCHALTRIRNVLQGESTAETEFFHRIYFKDANPGGWYGYPDLAAYFNQSWYTTEQDRTHRIYALLLAYEIAKGPRKHWP